MKKAIVFLDILGISSATICMAHCLIFPLLSILPFGLQNNSWVDIAFACIGMFVVSKLLMSDALKKVKIILGISILIVLTGVILEVVFDIGNELVLIGGIGMIMGHYLNYKSHKNKFY
jgi:hypothetical protein